MILDKLRIFLVRSIFFVLLREVFALGMFDLDFFENLFRLGSHTAAGPAQPTHCLTHSFPLHRCFQGLEKGCFGSKWNNRQDYGKGKRNRSSFKFIYLNKKKALYSIKSFIFCCCLLVICMSCNISLTFISDIDQHAYIDFATLLEPCLQYFVSIIKLSLFVSLQVTLEKFVATTFRLKPLF